MNIYLYLLLLLFWGQNVTGKPGLKFIIWLRMTSVSTLVAMYIFPVDIGVFSAVEY